MYKHIFYYYETQFLLKFNSDYEIIYFTAVAFKNGVSADAYSFALDLVNQFVYV